jgi:hypothetical protein
MTGEEISEEEMTREEMSGEEMSEEDISGEETLNSEKGCQKGIIKSLSIFLSIKS